MTVKSFRAGEALAITPHMEKSVAKAFNEFARKPSAPKQFNGTLRAFKDAHGCKHNWKPVAGLSKEHSEYLKSVTEEEPTPGSVKWCGGCGAVSYWEEGKLWLYDATAKFFGKPPKRKRRDISVVEG